MKTLTEKYYNIKNTRAIKVKFVGATNTKGSRIKLTDDYLSERKQSVFVSYDYSIGNVAEQGLKYLIDKGFNIIARASNENEYIFLVDNWVDDYKTLKGNK